MFNCFKKGIPQLLQIVTTSASSQLRLLQSYQQIYGLLWRLSFQACWPLIFHTQRKICARFIHFLSTWFIRLWMHFYQSNWLTSHISSHSLIHNEIYESVSDNKCVNSTDKGAFNFE